MVQRIPRISVISWFSVSHNFLGSVYGHSKHLRPDVSPLLRVHPVAEFECVPCRHQRSKDEQESFIFISFFHAAASVN